MYGFSRQEGEGLPFVVSGGEEETETSQEVETETQVEGGEDTELKAERPSIEVYKEKLTIILHGDLFGKLSLTEIRSASREVYGELRKVEGLFRGKSSKEKPDVPSNLILGNPVIVEVVSKEKRGETIEGLFISYYLNRKGEKTGHIKVAVTGGKTYKGIFRHRVEA